MGKTLKSFEELGSVLQDNLFNRFKEANPKERILILSERGISLNKKYIGIYNLQRNLVEFPTVKNPFTQTILTARLVSDEKKLSDGKQLTVFIKYEIRDTQNVKPEDAFVCETVGSVMHDFYRVKGIPITSDVDEDDIFLIFDLYIKNYRLKDDVKLDSAIRHLNKLICVNEKTLMAYMNRIKKTINDYELHGKKYISGWKNKKIVQMYELFCNKPDEYKKKNNTSIKRKTIERGFDIIDHMKVIKPANNIFTDNPSRKIRLNIKEEEIEKIIYQERIYCAPKYKNNVLINKNEIKFFCSIPEGRVCNLYDGEHLLATVTLTNKPIDIHRNGFFSRTVVKLDIPQEDIANKVEMIPEEKRFDRSEGKDDSKKKQDTHYIVKPSTEIFSLDQLHTNKAVVELKKVKKRIEFTNIKATNSFLCFSLADAVKEIQLIRGMRNHVTLCHEIENRTVTLVFYNAKRKDYEAIKILLHYCIDCDRYFDFYDSFLGQLNRAGINKSSILVRYVDEHYNEIFFDGISLREHSRLNLLGYRVGVSGLAEAERRKLLSRIIEEGYMTPAEIKNHLEFLINFRGKGENMELSKMDWEEDMIFINEILKS